MSDFKNQAQRILAAFIVSFTCIVILHLPLFTAILWVCFILILYDILVTGDQDKE